MASVVRRSKGQFQARIRRKGYPTLVNTFTTRQEALQCSSKVGSELTCSIAPRTGSGVREESLAGFPLA